MTMDPIRVPGEILPPEGQVDRALVVQREQDAFLISSELAVLLNDIRRGELALASNFARLGSLLVQIRAKRYWQLWGFHSWSAYIESIRGSVEKGRSQLYQVIGVAEQLLPVVSEQELVEMGISKAIELKRLLKSTGVKPSPEVVAKAKDPAVTIQELRAELATSTHSDEFPRPGTWYDLGGFYATPEERQEIERGFNCAIHTDPVIPLDWPEWARKKEVVTRLAQEYLATYEATVPAQ